MVGIFKFGSLQKSFELTIHKPEDQVRSILYIDVYCVHMYDQINVRVRFNRAKLHLIMMLLMMIMI